MAAYSTNFIEADGINIFYRSAGPKDAPVLLLLHGFPSSSHQYRNLIPLLSAKHHVIAPDLPGFGFTTVPAALNYKYNFDNLATTIEAFIDKLSIKSFSLFIFDYGAPTGLRIALRRPEAVKAIISQNGNAYKEGFGKEFWAPLEKYWASGAASDRAPLSGALTLESITWAYTHGANSPVAPEAPYLDFALLSRPGNQDIQLDLFYDYRTNVDVYPQFQEYFRKSQVPILAVWGKNDTIFVKEGAEAFKRDSKDAEVKLVDASHFALETNNDEIAGLINDFLERKGV